MKNFSVQYEKLEFDQSNAYILGLSKDDIKDIIIELMKFEYDKGKNSYSATTKIPLQRSSKKTISLYQQIGLNFP